MPESIAGCAEGRGDIIIFEANVRSKKGFDSYGDGIRDLIHYKGI